MTSHGSDLVVGPAKIPISKGGVVRTRTVWAAHHRDAISGFVKVLLRSRLWTRTDKNLDTHLTEPSLPVPSTSVKPTVRGNRSSRRCSRARLVEVDEPPERGHRLDPTLN